MSTRGKANHTKTLFLRHESGATHALRGKRLAKLLSELDAGRGMQEICTLQLNGYSETLGGTCLSDDCPEFYQKLQDEADGKVPPQE